MEKREDANLLGLRISLLKIEIWLKPLEKLVSNDNCTGSLLDYLRMVAFRTTALFVCSPLKLLAIALLTEIA